MTGRFATLAALFGYCGCLAIGAGRGVAQETLPPASPPGSMGGRPSAEVTAATTAAAAAVASVAPSVRMAAMLKHNPPPGWIRHYLGDDRYLIAGHNWDVVSTELDTFYHRPNCPKMLRDTITATAPDGKVYTRNLQDIVIGFNSPTDAQEAGYRADPACDPDGGGMTRVDMGRGGRGSVTTVNHGQKAMRITLADGKATVLLPPNWRRTQSGAQTVAGQSALGDVLQPLQGQGSIRFSFVNAPGGVNAEPFFKPQAFSLMFDQISKSNRVSPEAAALVRNSAVSAGSAGGMSGVLLQAPQGAGQVTVVARGSKIYVIEDKSAGAAGGKDVIGSFQPTGGGKTEERKTVKTKTVKTTKTTKTTKTPRM